MEISDVWLFVRLVDVYVLPEALEEEADHLEFVTTIYSVPIFETLTIWAWYGKVRFHKDGREISIVEAAKEAQQQPPDGFWVRVTGRLYAVGEGRGDDPIVGHVHPGGKTPDDRYRAQVRPWCWDVEASDVHFEETEELEVLPPREGG